MSIVTPTVRNPTKYVSGPPRPKRWTVEQFHQLWEQGHFDGIKAMLLDGEIVEMPIPGPPHDQGIGLADYAFKGLFSDGYWVRIQQTLPLGLWSDPIPDLVIVKGTPRDYPSLPTTALMTIEIADTSLDIDTGRKAVLCATARIADYWVVDLKNRLVIVFREPQPNPSEPGRFRYAQETRFDESATIAPLEAPQKLIRVADLLP